MAGPVRLAEEPDFDLGALHVRPSLREVAGPGFVERLEPRVMRVLVALARAKGGVVSRDALLADCWDGVIVGENAIDRVIGRLRRLSERQGSGIRVETLPRIGVRLTPSIGQSPAAVEPRPQLARRWPRLATGAAIVAMVLAGASGIVAWQSRRPAEWVVGAYRVISTDDESHAFPDLSPDGQWLVFARGPDAQPDLWLRRISGGEPILFAGGPERETAPAFSPDGAQIAFVRTDAHFSSASPPCRIYIKPVPAGAERLVGRCRVSAFTHRLAWSADGQALYFSEPTDPRTLFRNIIWRLSIADGGITAVTSPPTGAGGDLSPAVSADGRRLAFIRYASNQSADVHVQDLRSGEVRRITQDSGSTMWLDWAPDGRRLFVSTPRLGGQGLWAFDAVGREPPQRLLVGVQSIGRPSAARGLVAFPATTMLQQIVRMTGEREVVLASSAYVSSLAVGPDGTVAFITDDTISRLWLQRSGGRPAELRTLPLEAPGDLRFSPDGALLSLAASLNGDTDNFIVDVARGDLRRIPSPGMQVTGASWTPDGRGLIHSGYDGVGGGIQQRSLTDPSRITFLTGIGFPRVQASAEGLFACRVRIPGVWRITPGRPPTLAAPTRTPCDPWRTALGAVYVLEGERTPEAVIRRHPLEGGPAEIMARGAITDFAVDPRNGDLLLVRTILTRRDIGVLEVSRR